MSNFKVTPGLYVTIMEPITTSEGQVLNPGEEYQVLAMPSTHFRAIALIGVRGWVPLGSPLCPTSLLGKKDVK